MIQLVFDDIQHKRIYYHKLFKNNHTQLVGEAALEQNATSETNTKRKQCQQET